jgi:hypothetical protein
MAKKDKKKSKKKDNSGTDAVGAVRTAVERTFHATAEGAQSTRTRAQDLVDEVAGAAGRLREMVDQLSVLEDIKKQVEALSSRVAALERGGGSAKPAATTSRKPAASRKRATSRKPAARKTAARKTAARKTAARKTAAKSSGTTRKAASSRKKPAAKSSGTSKPASSRKPAAKQS